MTRICVWIVLAGLYLASSHIFKVYGFFKALETGVPEQGLWFMFQYGLTVLLPFIAGIFLLFQKSVGFWILVGYLVIRPLTLITLVNSGSVADMLLIYVFADVFIFVAGFVVWMHRHRLDPLWMKKPLGETQDA